MEGRLGNVAGVLWIEPRDAAASAASGDDRREGARRGAELLAALFDEVLLVGDAPAGTPGRVIPAPPAEGGALAGLLAALEATRAPRVLFLARPDARLCAEQLLALTAWPDHDVVRMRTPASDDGVWLIGRRDPVLERARRCIAQGECALSRLAERLDVGWIDDASLAAVVAGAARADLVGARPTK